MERNKNRATNQPNVVIATLSGVPTCHPFHFKAVTRGQGVICLLDTGATHNFIDEHSVAKWGLQVEEFSRFDVRVASGDTLNCSGRIPQLNIQMGDYTLVDDLYVIKLEGLNVILGMQWNPSIGRYTLDHRKMQLEFMDGEWKIELKALPNGGPRVVSAHRMEAILRHDDIRWAAQCFVSTKSSPRGNQQHHIDIQSMLDKHKGSFRRHPFR